MNPTAAGTVSQRRAGEGDRSVLVNCLTKLCVEQFPSPPRQFMVFAALTDGEGDGLRRCRFHGDVLLRDAAVSKKLEATGSRFEALLDLGKAKLNDFVYLEEIEQGDKQRFAFLNAVAERILGQPEQLAGRLASEQAGN